jgi:splicing factor 3B subunit 3
MRKNNNIVGGSNHLPFRSFYSPIKGVVDGDLCNLFSSLNEEEQSRIGLSMNMKVDAIK